MASLLSTAIHAEVYGRSGLYHRERERERVTTCKLACCVCQWETPHIEVAEVAGDEVGLAVVGLAFLHTLPPLFLLLLVSQ